MAELVIGDEKLAQRLRELAAQEQRSVEQVLWTMLANYEAKAAKQDPLGAFLDVFSGKALDMSKSVKATSENHYRKKYGDSD